MRSPTKPWYRASKDAWYVQLNGRKVRLSATYLSQVEQGNCDPPTAERVRRMAEILGENADELTALAGRVPDDLPRILQKQPARLAAFLREVSDLTADQIQVLTEQARRLKGNSQQ